MPNANRHILVVDDNPAIHQDFKKIFNYHTAPAAAFSEAEAALFGDDNSIISPPMPSFDIDVALQGHEGVALAREARAAERRYSVAFIDMRMPPGMDGMETTAAMWQEDPDIQIVICTAYSDYSWNEMLAKLGRPDHLVILKKPFDNIEVLQMANALSEKWRVAQQVRECLTTMTGTVEDRLQRLITLTNQVMELGAQARALPDAARLSFSGLSPHIDGIQRELELLVEQQRNELIALQAAPSKLFS